MENTDNFAKKVIKAYSWNEKTDNAVNQEPTAPTVDTPLVDQKESVQASIDEFIPYVMEHVKQIAYRYLNSEAVQANFIDRKMMLAKLLVKAALMEQAQAIRVPQSSRKLIRELTYF